MFYKLSNTATRRMLLKELGMDVHYPYLHRPENIINGLSESNVLIRTMNETNMLSISIWGILPENYEDEWQVFQNISNTLNFEIDYLRANKIFSSALKYRRCAIVVTGLFTTLIDSEGKTKVYHVHLKSDKPFYLAGIYNTLQDGFITCSVILNKSSNNLKAFHNVDVTSPVILNKKESDFWLNDKMKDEEIIEFINSPRPVLLEYDLISDDFYHDNFESEHSTKII